MDTAWAEGVLFRWLRLVTAARAKGFTSVHGVMIMSDKVEAVTLALAEDQTRQVVQRVLGGHPVLLGTTVSAAAYEIAAGEQLVRRALGRLRSTEETQANLEPAAPTMAVDALHPLVWNAASGLWDSGHPAQAVQHASAMLNAHVQGRVNRYDVADSALMSEVFSDREPQAGKPRLRWPGDDDDLTVKSMRSGLRQVPAGVFLTVRNPVSHGEDLSPQEALERLATLSMIARWIDQCEVITA